MDHEIVTPRLRLIPMNTAFVEAVLDLRRDDAAKALGINLTDAWPTGGERWLDLRLKQFRDDASAGPWLSRAVVLDGTLIGRAGFHHPPKGGESEFGYEIDPQFRRQGYASEAVRGFIEWGFSHPELAMIVACIAPANKISIHMVEALGFTFSRIVQDPVDGLELRYELRRDS
jgi:RimJ/RimL family protein N-acetyltransferase